MDTCRQISVPAQLQSQINTIFPNTTWGGSFTWKIAVYSDGENLGLPNIRIAHQVAAPSLNGPYTTEYDLTRILFDPSLVNDPPFTGNIEVTETVVANVMQDMAYRPLFASYGAYGSAMEGDPWNIDGNTGSPSVFSIFNNSLGVAGLWSADYESDYEYPAARELLRSWDMPAPSDVVAFDKRNEQLVAYNAAVDAGEPGYDSPSSRALYDLYSDTDDLVSAIPFVLRLSVTSIDPPVRHYSQLPQSGLWRRAATKPFTKPRTDVTEAGNVEKQAYFLHWSRDWGKSSYCRQQLLALGFTAEDLTP
jgi:hypothetical protein